MTGKAGARARKDAAGTRRKTLPRAATRTGRKTASARARLQAAAKPATAKVPARRPAAARPHGVPPSPADADLERDARLNALRREAATLRAEDDDDLDWLAEDDDPRKQIVEDDEEGDAHHDEW